jgi:predicted phage terminase large subunit-like protein
VQEWNVAGYDGGVIARGISGSIVGRRLRVAIVDDPIRHMSDAYSEAVRERVWSVWQGVIKTRMRPGSIVLSIATRWHDDDLNGRLLKADGWEHLVIPAFAEEDDALGREPGDPLLSVQKQETPEEAAAGYDPGQLNGTVYKLEWWRYYAPSELPAADQIVTSWDLSFGDAKKKRDGSPGGDWCVGQAWQRTGNRYFLLDQVRFRGDFTEQIKHMKEFIGRFPEAMVHVVEKAANGAAAISTLQRELNGVVPVPPEGSKTVRAQAVSPLAEAHQVYLPEGVTWVDGFVYEHTAFPTGAHDDQVDASSYGLRRLRESDVGPVAVMPDRPRLP